ncbi:MAG: hypothetical protein ISR65_12695 [Bacteriovoracaceae bacterium]|nr:hypothetical protein [Bacteriovoracaceae bacterium]
MKKYISILLFLTSIIQNSFAKEITCQVWFKFDSIVVNKKSLTKCVSQVNQKYIDFVHIFATASDPGTMKYNRKLSLQRARAVKQTLIESFPKIKNIVVKEGGEHPDGQQATIFVYANTNKHSQAITLGQAAVSKTREPINEINQRLNLFSFRVGQERYRMSNNNYKSVGIDYKRMKLIFSNNFFLSYGVSFTSYADDSFLDLYGIYGTLGVDYKYQNFILGIESFAGGFSHFNKRVKNTTVFDPGGNTKIGFDSEAYTATINYGISKSFEKLTFNFGIKF